MAADDVEDGQRLVTLAFTYVDIFLTGREIGPLAREAHNNQAREETKEGGVVVASNHRRPLAPTKQEDGLLGRPRLKEAESAPNEAVKLHLPNMVVPLDVLAILVRIMEDVLRASRVAEGLLPGSAPVDVWIVCATVVVRGDAGRRLEPAGSLEAHTRRHGPWRGCPER